jgi:hypothetical protein
VEELHMAAEERRLAAEQRGLEGELKGLVPVLALVLSLELVLVGAAVYTH